MPCWESTGWPVRRRFAELADLFVDPMVIGRGVGATLLADAVDRARALGVSRLVITADPHAAGFYMRMGARRVGSVASSSLVGRMLPRFDLVTDPAGG